MKAERCNHLSQNIIVNLTPPSRRCTEIFSPEVVALTVRALE